MQRNKRLNIRISDKEYELLESFAYERQLTISELVRLWIHNQTSSSVS